MSEAIVVAVIAAIPGVLGAVLGYLNRRSIKRETDTGDSLTIGRLVERLDRKVDRLIESIGDLRERVARLEGRVVGPLPLPTGRSDPERGAPRQLDPGRSANGG